MLYDCFTFFDELELLHLRLSELEDAVDRFVLVEANTTHTGVAKPLIFKENRAKFSRWLPRIIHVVCDLPAHVDNAWVRENYQRNAIILGLQQACSDDTAIVSDLDEIPRPANLPVSVETASVYALNCRMYYYWLNNSTEHQWNWLFPKVCSVELLRQISPQQIRFYNGPQIVVNDGGWHFSYLGGAAAIKRKLASFAHTEYSGPKYTDEEWIREAIKLGVDIFGRPDVRMKRVDIDESYPKTILANLDQYKHLILDQANAAGVGGVDS